MPDPNLQLLEDAVRKLAPILDEIVFVGGVTLGLLITDEAAAPIRGTTDVDVIAEIVTYADYIAFSERLRQVHFTEDAGERPLTCRWHNGTLTLDVLALNKDVLGFTNIWYEPALRHASTHMLRCCFNAFIVPLTCDNRMRFPLPSSGQKRSTNFRRSHRKGRTKRGLGFLADEAKMAKIVVGTFVGTLLQNGEYFWVVPTPPLVDSIAVTI
jgi:hypothetical protein